MAHDVRVGGESVKVSTQTSQGMQMFTFFVPSCSCGWEGDAFVEFHDAVQEAALHGYWGEKGDRVS